MRKAALISAFATLAAVGILAMSYEALAQKPKAVRAEKTRPRLSSLPNYVSKDSPADIETVRLQVVSLQQDVARYKGLEVEDAPDAVGRAAIVRRKLAKLLVGWDYVPDARSEHFRPLTDGGRKSIVGWTAKILDLKDVPDGHVITLKIHPKFVDGGFATSDFTVERYFISNDRLELLHIDGPTAPMISTQN